MHLNIRSRFLIFLFGFCIVTYKSYAYCPPYFAHIDSVKPENADCLKISTYGACGGDLEITNSCPWPLYIENEKILSDSELDPNSNTTYFHEGVSWHGEPINGRILDQLNWKLTGTLGDTAVAITGRTVHEDPSGGIYLPFVVYIVALFIILLIFLFGVLYLKKINRKTRVSKVIFIMVVIIFIFLTYNLMPFVSETFKGFYKQVQVTQVNSSSYQEQLRIINKVLENKDVKICENVSDQSLKGACVAISKLDVNGCKTLTNQDLSDWCIKKIALSSNNELYCSEVVDADLKDLCFMHVAVNKNNPSICKNIAQLMYISERASKDDCYESVAINNKNKLFCNCIEEDRTFEDCNLIIDKTARGTVKYTKTDQKPSVCTK